MSVPRIKPVAPTLLDRAITHVMPELGMRRLRARAQIAAFEAFNGDERRGSRGRRGGRGIGGADAATDTLWDLPELRRDSRELVRSHGIAASAINTNVTRAVGTGLALSAQPQRAVLGWTEDQARDWKARVQAEFSLWADSQECDLCSTGNFYDLQDLVLRSMLESGDSFTLLPDGERTATMPYALRLQVLEADRIGNEGGRQDTREQAGGIRFGTGGAPVEYYVYDHHPGSLLPGTTGYLKGQWYPRVGRQSGRRVMLHHFKQLRPEQPRGVPYLAPVMQLFQDLGVYSDAEIKAAVAAASIALLTETATGAPDPIASAAEGSTASTLPPGTDPTAIKLKSGSVVGLLPGEKFESFNPGRPNPNFGGFVQAVLDQLGAGLFIGPEMLMKKYNTSYVAARAAFLDAWKHLLGMRTVVIRTFCQPVYETWLAEAVSIGRIAAPGFFADPLIRWAYTRATWTGDSQGSINPKDEVAAFTAAVDARLCTRERAEWELFGSDFNETYDTKKSEQDRLRTDGLLPEPKAGAAAPAQPMTETA